MFTLSMCILQSLSVRYFIMLPNIRQGWDCGLKTLKPIFVKLKHLFLASLSSLVPCLWARTRSYYILEYLKRCSIRQGSGHTHKQWIRLERLERCKNSRLLQKLVNYRRNIFYYTTSCGRSHKHFTSVTYTHSKISCTVCPFHACSMSRFRMH